MAALGGTASVIAVVTATLQSARAIHIIVSGIKDAPSHVQDLMTNVTDLRMVLDLVNNLHNLATGNAHTQQARHLSELENTTQRCLTDLQEFEAKLARLWNGAGDRRLTQMWKSVKIMLKEDEFFRMGKKIGHYVQALGLQLSVLGRMTDVEQSSGLDVALSTLNQHTGWIRDIRVQSIQNESSNQNTTATLNQHSTTLSSMSTRLDRIQDVTEESSTRITSFQEVTKKTLEQNTNTLSDISSGVNYIKTSATASNQAVQQGLAEVSTRLIALEEGGMSKAQGDEIIELFRFFKRGIETSSSSSDTPTEFFDDSVDEFSRSIDMLCQLAEEKAKTVYSNEAQSIITNLEEVLHTAGHATDLSKRDTMKRKREDSSQDVTPDLKRLKGILTSSPAIALNHEELPLSMPSGVPITSKSRFKLCENDNQTISLLVKSHRRRKNDSDEDGIREEVFSGKVTVMPAYAIPSGGRGIRILASLQQKVARKGVFSLKPTLTFSAVIPDNSEIFQMAASGDLEGLVKLFMEGKASLTDCNVEGRTLLTYAVEGDQPAVCKFLLENGADADCVYKNHNGHMISPLAAESLSPNQSTRRQIGKMLLDAGADPTLDIGETMEGGSPLVQALSRGLEKLEMLRLFLNRGSIFVDLEEPLFDCGSTPLLTACDDMAMETETVALLISHGASVEARDASGRTCLHIALGTNKYDQRRPSVTQCLREVLTILLEAGADVFAECDQGISVSYVAYWANRGKMWEEVLTACGHDASEVCGGDYHHYSRREKRFNPELQGFPDLDDETDSGDEDTETGGVSLLITSRGDTDIEMQAAM
ncbi:ankyrin [Wilcoxina mikolae CBS 423.85]|nr:ankyrin [Wilcoxina mikolae CBS 423.85]